jgi:hypothetical protein
MAVEEAVFRMYVEVCEHGRPIDKVFPLYTRWPVFWRFKVLKYGHLTQQVVGTRPLAARYCIAAETLTGAVDGRMKAKISNPGRPQDHRRNTAGDI